MQRGFTSHCSFKSSGNFPVSDGLGRHVGSGPLCFLTSTVKAAVYQEFLEHFILPSAYKMLILFPSRTWCQPTLPKAPEAGSVTLVFLILDWPADIPDL